MWLQVQSGVLTLQASFDGVQYQTIATSSGFLSGATNCGFWAFNGNTTSTFPFSTTYLSLSSTQVAQ